MPPQAAGMSCYSVAEEIMPRSAGYLVELRGFEPLTSAMQHPRALQRGRFRFCTAYCRRRAAGSRPRSALLQKPVEVRASVHRRSSPRPSSFQIQVKS